MGGEHSLSDFGSYLLILAIGFFQLAETRPVNALKWLERNITHHRSIIFDALISNMKHWVERFLLKEANSHARVAAGELLLRYGSALCIVLAVMMAGDSSGRSTEP